MPSLHLRGLSYAHTSATTVLDRIDLDLSTDGAADDGVAAGTAWIGVVGANGAGKSTLLRLLAGELAPTSGRIDVHAAAPPRLVPQTVDRLTDEVRAFAWSWDGVAERLRRRLDLDPGDLDPDDLDPDDLDPGGLDPGDLDPDGLEPEKLDTDTDTDTGSSGGRGWAALSPGQRARWQVAAALAEEPDVLLLDEPTNHLDVGARALLLDALAGFRGLGLVVSHDRSFLAELTTRTLRLHRGGVELHAGAYPEASARWRAADEGQRDAHGRANRALRRERRLLGDLRRDRHSAEVGPRRARRLAGASEPDTREKGRQFAQQKAEKALAARVRQENARVDRAERAVDAIEVHRELGGDLGFHHRATGRRVLAEVRGDVPHAGGEPWLLDVDVALERGARVHLTGPNGAGKTTLLTALLAVLGHTDEVVARLEQELADPVAEVAHVRALDRESRGRVLGVLAALGVDPDRVLVTDAPSPGEARKLRLARALAADASVLVLDEPTNHLDLPSIERLQDALAGWPGALLLVTHDPVLASAVTTSRWHVTDRRVRVERAEPAPP